MSQLSDPIGDLFTRINNSVRAGHDAVDIPYSKMKGSIAHVLKQEGYIADYGIDTGGKFPILRISHKHIDGRPAISGIRRVSRPGLRKYTSAVTIPRVLGGMGVAIVSTSVGVMSGLKAKKSRAGGELLGIVW